MFRPISNLLLTVSLLNPLSLAGAEGMSNDELIQIYKNFDAALDDTPPCLEEDYNVFMCPDDESLVCAGDSELKSWCEDTLVNLGLTDTDSSDTILDGTNAVNGCMVYTGWGEDQRGCCTSEECHIAMMEEEGDDDASDDSDSNDENEEGEEYEYEEEEEEHDEF